MFGSLIKSTVGIVKDTVDIVSAPVAVAADVARVVTKPIADAVTEVAEEIHDELKVEPDCKTCKDTGVVYFTTPSGRTMSESCTCKRAR